MSNQYYSAAEIASFDAVDFHNQLSNLEELEASQQALANPNRTHCVTIILDDDFDLRFIYSENGSDYGWDYVSSADIKLDLLSKIAEHASCSLPNLMARVMSEKEGVTLPVSCSVVAYIKENS